MRIFDSLLSLSIPALILLHLYWAPFTKVEESFNIQATHDILTYGIPSSNIKRALQAQYDHFTFPGAVPRTFVGALVLAGLSRPWVSWLSSRQQLQTLIRGVLGLLNAFALLSFRTAVAKLFGRAAGNWYILLQATQFHVIYYASRTLPNMFAFGLTTFALRELLLSYVYHDNPQKRMRRRRLSLYLLTVTGIIFRSEIAILLVMQTLYLLFRKRVSPIKEVIPAGIAGTVIGLVLTISIDSFFWQSFPLWPEWVGFYYNTLQGRSADWGTSPWHFYITNAIPRLMMNPMSWLVCIPVAVGVKATRSTSLDTLVPLLAFVAAYSLLPHKEWRFIIYVIPGLTATAAAGVGYIWVRRGKSFIYRLLALAIVASTITSFMASCRLLAISRLNYPGADALLRLHKIAHGSKSIVRVHMDNLACQTGVTRFLQKHPPKTFFDPGTKTIWLYDKSENTTAFLDPEFWQKFDYALMEKQEKAIGKWEVVDVVDGFAGIGLSKLDQSELQGHGVDGSLHCSAKYDTTEWLLCYWTTAAAWLRSHVTRGWWLTIKMEPKIRILKRQPF